MWLPWPVFTTRWLVVTIIRNIRIMGSSMLPTIREATTTRNRLMLGTSISMVETLTTVATTL